MRWLVIHPGPNFSVSDVHNGWVEALSSLGEQVQVFNLDDRLNFYDAALLETGGKDEDGRPELKKAKSHEQAIELAAYGVLTACYQWWPDVVLGVSAFFTPPVLLQKMHARGHRIVLLHTESPYQDDEQVIRGEHADINLLNDPINIERYRQLGVPALYMPHAYRPELHCPGAPDPRMACDVAFSGTGYTSRIKFFEAMDLQGLDLALAGNWMSLGEDSPLNGMLLHEKGECLDNEQTVDLYRSAKAGINIYRLEGENTYGGEGWAMGPREIEMAATGLFFIRDPRPESDKVFPMLPTFSGPEDASEKLRWYAAHDDARQKAAAQARAAIADRTFETNVKTLLAALDR